MMKNKLSSAEQILRVVILVFVIALSYSSFGQDKLLLNLTASIEDDILTCTKFRKGIYTSFDELRWNAPTNQNEFTLEEKAGVVIRYILRYKESGKKVKRDVYGFSDGTDVYVSARNYKNGNHFVKIQEIGRYFYFKDVITDEAAKGLGAFGLIGGAVSVAFTGERGLIININNGNVYALTKSNIKRILENDPELYEQYKNEKEKGDIDLLYFYLMEYNERNVDQIASSVVSGKS